ncbi:hypothetical protein NQ317_019917 [Molorchus minor]|uniref:Lactate/malate dehydrogenase C-terminal domain-containing protein n=1 Tax=Molorchus minor TaxID=1323400 RepID=A0ABQ9K5F9_9CUCU|nr:hypothetical protein NQ317_019917 [Molorchus minor]
MSRGVSLKDLNPDIGSDKDPENWKQVHKNVVNAAYDVIKLKGYTSWAIGLSVANLAKSVLRNTNNVHAVSVFVKGVHGIEDEVFLSLPSVLGQNGVNNIVMQTLSDEERQALLKSVEVMVEVQKTLKF